MKIASIGLEFPSFVDVDGVHITSRHTFLDFDVLIFDLAGIREELKGHRIDLTWRHEEILQMLEMGRNIFVFMHPFNMRALFPFIEDLEFDQGAGRRILYNGQDKLKPYWDCVKDFSAYTARWRGEVLGKPFLTVEGVANAIVGSHLKYKAGNIFFMPGIQFRENMPNDAEHVVQAITLLVQSLKPNALDRHLSKWTLDYGWGHLNQLSKELSDRIKELKTLTQVVEDCTQARATEDGLKLLLAGTGDALAAKVIEVMREIGFKAKEGPTGRDDIILEWDEKFAVVEVKGKAKSAAESDAAQLEKWVATHQIDRGVSAKGILIINAFCDTPLKERTGAPFPHQMLKYSQQRGHCLITTVQLLGILLEIRLDPSKRAELLESLFSAVGVYPRFSDYQAFMTCRAKS